MDRNCEMCEQLRSVLQNLYTDIVTTGRVDVDVLNKTRKVLAETGGGRVWSKWGPPTVNIPLWEKGEEG